MQEQAWVSSTFGQIQQLTVEIAVLERLKNRGLHFFAVATHPINFKFTDNEDMNNILNEFGVRPDRTTDC